MVPQKAKHRIRPGNSVPRHIPKRTEIRGSNRYLNNNLHCSTIHNGQKVETSQVSISRKMDKQSPVCTYERVFFNHKRECSSDRTWMYLVNIMLSSVSQSQKDRYYMTPLIGNICNRQNRETESRTVTVKSWQSGASGVIAKRIQSFCLG